ncbi:neural cell adhesion molecule 1 isoform X1 [Cephus cinctus]|uniref:Neural cell adhesion molecule 1 isoform X1 n=2 Tax=Cephus cinctus TaxID=211228 RepID=A0AAJ7REV8_CEPCN|nr:neural cell adhesion molecule 1 isoform X1 [Cephus cinctus]
MYWMIFFWVAGHLATMSFLSVGQAAVNQGFKSVPTTVKTFENDTVLLPCYVDNFGVPTRVRWWRKDTLLADSGEPNLVLPPRIKMYGNKSLEVVHVQPEDTGEYVCQASRPAPSGYVNQVHAIEVMYPPSVQPVPRSGELEVNLGEEVDMACEVEGVPYPVVSWVSKGEVLQLLDDRPRLRFRADSRNLSGQYTCVATNGVGEAAMATIDLRIRHKPSIQTRKNWVHASPGIRAQLDCRVTSWPEAKVEWFFEDQRVPYSSRIVKHSYGEDHSLIIRNVRTLDYGYYLCRASNSVGISEEIIELSGVANPAIFKESHPVGRTAYNFIWEVDSYSLIIDYQFWFRKYSKGVHGQWHKLYIPSGSEAIGPVHARAFNLTGLAPATHYEAVVLSRNSYGISRPSKIMRFSTDGATTESEQQLFEKPNIPKEKILPAVEVASMSQHLPPVDTESNDAYREQSKCILIILPMILNFFNSY